MGVIKTYLGEVTDQSNQARAMSFLALVWQVGSIGEIQPFLFIHSLIQFVAGPICGGFFSQPTLQYDWFPPDVAGGFFHTFPFLLPNLLGALLTSVAFFLAWFYLPESRPKTGCIPTKFPFFDVCEYSFSFALL